MNAQPNSTEARDILFHLHPNTDARLHQKVGPLVIARGDGIFVEDTSGRRYLEAMSGLWSVGLGFSEKRLADAAYAQMCELPFYHTFTHKVTGPAVDLAAKLVSIAPVPMSKVFFTNSGSEANDTAMKMIWYRSNAMGRPEKKKLIARRKGFHGVTVGAASLTGLAANHVSFDLPIANVLHVSCPDYWREARDGESEEDFADRLARELEDLILAEGPETVAGFFGEPVMGAGGVIVPPKGYWPKIQAVLRKYDVLLVADEVICGFGRTGNMFGSETFGIEPDMMILSKQLSSSYLPISAVLMNERVFEPLADESARLGLFGHGLTAGGHPVTAAVALENIRIIEEEGLVDHVREVGAHLQRRLAPLADHPLVGHVRGIGLLGALELVADKKTNAPLGETGVLGRMANARLQEAGLIARNMGDAIALCPPMIITHDQIDLLVDMVTRVLDQLASELEP